LPVKALIEPNVEKKLKVSRPFRSISSGEWPKMSVNGRFWPRQKGLAAAQGLVWVKIR
jgi:hypothetical protein